MSEPREPGMTDPQQPSRQEPGLTPGPGGGSWNPPVPPQMPALGQPVDPAAPWNAYGAPAPMPAPAPIWQPKPPALPTQPREYHEFWLAPRYRWWKGLLVLLCLGAGMFAFSTVLVSVSMIYDLAMGNVTLEGFSLDQVKATPAMFAANNVSLALLVPLGYLLARAFTGQPMGYLTSVARTRWKWMGLVALALLPLFVAQWIFEVMTVGIPKDFGMKPWTIFTLVVIVLTTPFQAAAEEIMIRGVLTRAIGSWIKAKWIALGVAAAVSAAVFATLHMAADPWLNVFYVVFGLAASYLTWRTGGLEAAIALHAINNVFAESFFPFIDYSDVFNRAEGVVAFKDVIPQLAVILLAVVIVELLMRKVPVVRAAAPGLEPTPVAT